jgi:hypothetical protein
MYTIHRLRPSAPRSYHFTTGVGSTSAGFLGHRLGSGEGLSLEFKVPAETSTRKKTVLFPK